MALNKKKKTGKKDELKGAMHDEISSGSIMGDFINNVNNDKKNEKSSSKKDEEYSGSAKPLKSLTEGGKSLFSGSLPVIRNSNQKEWWVSIGSFATVITLVLLLFFAFGSSNKYQIQLASTAIENYAYGTGDSRETFEIGKPVYIYFGAKSAIKSDKIYIHVINLNQGDAEEKMATIESNINPKWKVVETHFQKEFFETPGNYKIVIENEKKKVLVEKTFSVK